MARGRRTIGLVKKDAPRLLVVDDDADLTAMLARSLARHGFEVEQAHSSEDALARSAAARFDAAVVDLVMPGAGGASLAEALRKAQPGLTVAVLTGYQNSPLIAAARAQGLAVFPKPTAIQDLAAYLKLELGRPD